MTLFNAQLKAEQLVAQDIYLCQTSLVEKLFAFDDLDTDDIKNQWLTDNTEGFTSEEIADNEHWAPKEVLEWWAISDRLKEHLLSHDEVILENDYGTWWGRCTSGQAIAMDSVIQDIAAEVYSS